MSETAKPRDDQDVLSSIRRLVTEEPAPTAVADRPHPLLLTPALRVAPVDPTPDRTGIAAASEAFCLESVQRTEAPVRPVRETWPLFLADAPPAPPAPPAAPTESVEAEEIDAATLEQRIAELEAAVAGCDEDWEPDGTEALSAATGWARPASPSAARPEADPAAPEDGDAILMDEEMLRELVTDIVRQELQGPMGERITRNVRKLVRRELNRALTMRDIE